MTTTTDRARTARTSTTADTASGIFGWTFIAVGVLGFIPGVTTQYGALEWIGPDSEALLLGLFEVSILHNLVHLLLGVLGLAAAAGGWARSYLVGGGLAYAALAIYGFLIEKDSAADFVPLNTADDWLHVVLAVAMILAGLALGRGTVSGRT
jgi:hypothetical protein